MAETRASRSKGKKLDSIISKLKIHSPVEEPSAPNKEKTEADISVKRSKRKPGKIVRYRIDDDDDDDDDDGNDNNDQTEERAEPQSENNPEEDTNTDTKNEDDSLPKTIFEELPNGEANFEEGEDTTVLFLPSEEIQVKAGPSEYCQGLFDDQDDYQDEEVEEEGKEKESMKKKKKRKSYESDESLDEDGLPRRVTCTACGRHVNPAHGTILRHPILNVLVCKKCNQYYNSGPFTRDEYGIEEQCRWCGDGGDLICCDKCEKVYCKPCIQRNCGKTFLKNLLNAPEDFKWLCIVCNKDKPLRHIQRLRKKCEMVMEALDRIKAQKAHFKSKKGKQSSVVVGPTPLERRSRLTCLSEGIGVKGESFSSSGESPTKKSFSKEDLPAELFSKSESEEEIEKRKSMAKNKNEKDEKKREENDKMESESKKDEEIEEDEIFTGRRTSRRNKTEARKEKEATMDEDNKLEEINPFSSEERDEDQSKPTKRRSLRKIKSVEEEQEQGTEMMDGEKESAAYDMSGKEGGVLEETETRKSVKNKDDVEKKDTDEEKDTKFSEEEVEKNTTKRRSSRRLQSNDESVKLLVGDEANEDEKESDTLKSNDKVQTKNEKADSDSETTEKRTTRSQKTQKVKKGEFKEKESSNDEFVDKKEQETKKKKKKEQNSTAKKTKLNEEEENEESEDEKAERRTTRSKKEPTNKEDKTKKKGKTRAEKLDGDEDLNSKEIPKDEDEQNILGSSSEEEETKPRRKETKKKDAKLKKIKKELESEEQDSSDFMPEKRPPRKSKASANEVLQKKSGTTETRKKPAEVILIESSDEDDSAGKVEERKDTGKRKGKEKKDADVSSAKQNERKSEDSVRSSRRSKGKQEKTEKSLEIKKEENISSSTSESEKEKRNMNKRKRNKKSSEEEEEATDEDSSEEMSDDDSESDIDSTPLKKKRNQPPRKKTKAKGSSSESNIDNKKKSRRTKENKKRKLLKESSESEDDFVSMVKKTNKTNSEDEENDYVLDESSESDAEKTSEEGEESSESDQQAKRRRRGRGVQKQTRKRPRRVQSSSSDSEKSTEESGIARRTRKRRQDGSESSDVGTKKGKKTKRKGKSSEKKKRKTRRGKRKSALDSDDEDGTEEEVSEEKSESSSESESEQEDKPKSRQSKRQKQTRKKKLKKIPQAKKKRRRIRKNSGSETDEDDEQEEKSPKKGRKKIRKLLTDEKLGEETQKARRLEEERRKRLLERTRTAEDEEMPKEDWRMSCLVLEKDDETKEPVVQVQQDLVQHLKPHQAKGIQFMYDNLVDSVKAYKKGDPGGGCILAHCMGLGKTLQVVALIHTLFNNEHLDFKTALVIAPLNTVLNWQVEFDKWLGVDDRMEVFVLKEAGSDNWRRADMLKQWQRYGGVMIMGYDMYRNLALCHRTRSKHQKKIFKQSMVDPGPDIVVCDEGHILRNDQSAISKTVNDIKTKRRVVLTGTPLQNNLIEYHCMVSFVKPSLLGTRREFMNTFGNPIMNGQCADSTPIDVRLMKQRCHVLFKLLEGCVQRRDYSVLTPFLPPKHEYVIKIRLSESQRKLYEHYLKTFVYPEGDSRGRGASLFSDYQALMRIWTHPWCLKLEAIRRSLRASYEDTDDSLDGFVVHTDEEEESEPSLSSNESLSLSEDSDQGKNKNKKKKNGKFQLESSSEEESKDNTSDEEVMPQPTTRRATRSQAPTKTEEAIDIVEVDVNGDVKPERTGSNTRSGAIFKEDEPVVEEKEWYDEFLTDEDEYNVELSGKMAMLLEILADAEAVEEKVLVFSQSLVTLDLIERALGGGEVDGDRENWCRGCDYFRMDGSTSVQLRQRWADIFNDVDNKTARLFLISTKAGGLGINLIAANRVIVFDVSWNPSHDVQSIFRVYRFGQTRPVYVYRLVTQGTMEERIYDRQVAKLSISERVIDKHQIERHFTAADLAELYTFNPEIYDEEKDKDSTPKLPLPKDAVLADLINRMHPKWIVKYHEHDSLLQNIEGEELTEEECQMAWSAYKEQKDQTKNQERVRALQAAYAQQQLQQQRQAIPQQNAQYNNVLLQEMQQLQQQQLSGRMSRYQVDVMRLQQERQRYLQAQNQTSAIQQSRTEQLRHQLLQHVGATHSVYPTHPPPGPGTTGPTYQPMMTYLSQQQQQQQQQHVLRQPGPSNQMTQLPQSQPLVHPRPTAPPMSVIPQAPQYRR